MPEEKPVRKRKRDKDYRDLSDAEVKKAIKAVTASADFAPDILNQLSETIEIGEKSISVGGIELPKPNLYGLRCVFPYLKKLSTAQDETELLDIIAEIIWILKNQDKARPDLKNPPEKEVAELMTKIDVEDLALYVVLIKKAFVDDIEALKKSLRTPR